jgi:hypothetical protein
MKKITRSIIALAALLFSGDSFAQFNYVWNAQFQHTATPGYSNEGRKIAIDPNGNIFVLSDVTSDMDPVGIQTTNTYHYANVTKYTPNGNIAGRLNIDVQDHLVSGQNHLGAFGIVTDAAGNVYIGYSYYAPITGFDIALTKYDNDLTRIWLSTYSTNGDDFGVEMKLHPSGKLYAVARSQDGFNTSYSLIENGTGITCNVIYSYAPNGAVINSMAIDGAQTAYVCGYVTKGGFKNAYVGAINLTAGSISWGSIFSPPGVTGDDVANKVVVGTDGNIYTVGSSDDGAHYNKVLVLKNLPGNNRFEFTVLLGDPSVDDIGLHIDASIIGWITIGSISGGNSPVIYRIPDDGIFNTPGMTRLAVVPNAPYNTIPTASIADMKVSSASNIYVSGGISATGPSGAFTCSYLEKVSVVFGNALMPAGGVVVDGDFDRNFEGGNIALDYSKVDVYWLRNYWDDVHSEEKVELVDVNVPSPMRLTQPLNHIWLSPNPATELITISTDPEITKIEVTDMTGKLVFAIVPVSSQVSINVSDLTPGIYFCKIRTGTEEKTQRFAVN